MTASDFTDVGLVRPEVGGDDAVRIAREVYGLEASARELGSQQDRNYLLETDRGRFLLKIDNAAFADDELAAQDTALTHLANLGLHVPAPVPGPDGATRQSWQGHRVRLLTFLEGRPLASAAHVSRDAMHALGRLSGSVASALAGFTAPGLERALQWDLRVAPGVVRELLPFVPDASRRVLIERAVTDAWARVATVADRLRVQPIHGDITDDNVVCTPDPSGRSIPDGVIDFGDLGLGWRVAELAVTLSSLLPHADDLADVFAAVRAFHAESPLDDAELSALWPLVVLRGAVLVVSGEHQVSLEPGNDYAAERMAGEWRIFELARSVDPDLAEAAVQAAAGAEAPAPLAPATRLLPELGETAVLDLSVDADALAAGRWLEPDAEWLLALEALAGHDAVVLPFGQRRLTRTPVRSVVAPETAALVTELVLRAGSPVVAPFDGEIVEADATGLLLRSAAGDLEVGPLELAVPLGPVTAGTLLGRTSSCPDAVRKTDAAGHPLARLRVRHVRLPELEAPDFTSDAWFPAWARVVADPAPLLGLDPLPQRADPDAEQHRRERLFASAQERYYAHPPQIERGWREFLIDTAGRSYVDMVNNVSGIGHGHPALTEAVARQLAKLNTNSRFLYRALADLSERLVALAPHPSLDTVLLVNSGTEAVDLAIRLAQLATGRRTIVALREGYHGWSMATDAVTTSAYDNPSALANRPDWVRIADVPNAYRGTHRGPDAAEAYARDFAAFLEGESVAGFVAEPILGNAGGVVPPEGYLAAAYEAVRANGGLCIADEVQVGYGRIGSHFWASEWQGVVPDIVTTAKAMGNAYPLGAVLTRREIAEALATEGHFFSSAGGAPASCAAGIAVLDVMEREGLQQNAAEVGAHLVQRFEALAAKHPLIGAVHGRGLYLGVELVRDRQTLEPADAETQAICDRMLDLGVIVQPTSERQNVLKIKPPLCLSRQSADFVVDALDEVLTRGW
ncbi:aminotransferase [Desertivibrio insolitus]|uniref:aminotransferase n=1 Tax=Herbiconiux sp. SYSU D00978 TaxID=2812562 RepID=UPI001A96F7D1|nr:aminotransferase [Herbiconiux sp. SYSU D00978]